MPRMTHKDVTQIIDEACARAAKRTRINRKVTPKRVADACERAMRTLDDPGFCIACGLEQGGCEPDARKIKCEACGERAVYGAEELAMMMM